MRRHIVIADATEARIFCIDEDARSLLLVRQLRHPLSRLRPHEINSDEPGRLKKGKRSQSRSAMEPRTDAHLNQLHRFAKEIGDVLLEAYNRRHFEDLALVAPPRFLGLLRKEVQTHAIKCLRKCVARNCTHVAALDLAAHLGNSLSDWFEQVPQRASQGASLNEPLVTQPVKEVIAIGSN